MAAAVNGFACHTFAFQLEVVIVGFLGRAFICSVHAGVAIGVHRGLTLKAVAWQGQICGAIVSVEQALGS